MYYHVYNDYLLRQTYGYTEVTGQDARQENDFYYSYCTTVGKLSPRDILQGLTD